ncbi:MAG: hypothetical protein ACXIUQ_09255 [Cecembia sp.]
MDLNELNKQLGKFIDEQNKRSVPEFEGYSPEVMNILISDPFGPQSPIQLKRLTADAYRQVPFLNQVKYLCGLTQKAGEIKLTSKGYLPTKVVSELYEQGFMKDEFIESGLYKLYKETDANSVHLTRILMELSALAKKRIGKLSLTKTGEKLLKDDFELLLLLLKTFLNKFNWGYFDGFSEVPIGPLGFGFSLILLSKYGDKERLDDFYAEKYFGAFPALLEGLNPGRSSLFSYSRRCYSIRTFDRCLEHFGLVAIRKEGSIIDATKYIRKTDLMDQLVRVEG